VTAGFSVLPLAGMPEVEPGADLGRLIESALQANNIRLTSGDIVVVAQKVVSKAEGRFRTLQGISPSAEAQRFAAITGKDARLVELILTESSAVIRAARDVLIVRHRLGLVMANAGIDRSNVPLAADGGERLLLLPIDPDASAGRLRETLRAASGVDSLGVLIADSFGRPWRQGVVNVAIGAAGLPVLLDRRGEPDREGRRLEMTEVAFGDAVCAAAALAQGEAAEGQPVALVRGLRWTPAAQNAATLLRPLAQDLFP
jgi:coenzyme F420-0:L-glutamate ligase/coenzyme F420-1:gamma-L-glutamate ligase